MTDGDEVGRAAGSTGAPGPRIERLRSEMEMAWDEYVNRHLEASVFHLLGWKRVVERSFGHRPFYLIARRGGKIVGVLPLFLVRGLLCSRQLVSLPFAIRGGVLADDSRVAAALLERARSDAVELRVAFVEMRSERAAFEQLETLARFVTFRADLTLDEAELLRRMEKKRRQMMNYARRAGYEGRFVGPEELQLFYRLFCQSMRSHGTPVYPLRFLGEILAQYPQQAKLYFAYQGGKPLAGVLTFLFRGEVMPFYAGTDRFRRPRGLDDFLYWSLMRWGRQQGFKSFDFGRSRKGTGAYKFKARWGMQEVPLGYQRLPLRSAPRSDLSPESPRLKPLIRVWRRMPLWVTRLLGPRIIRSIP